MCLTQKRSKIFNKKEGFGLGGELKGLKVMKQKYQKQGLASTL